MPKDLFAQFPHIASDSLVLRQIEPADADDLFAIYANETLFRYTPGSARKSLNAVQNMVGHFARDFAKRKCVFLGICPASDPRRVVGIAEVFDYDPKLGMATIGYRLNEAYWSRGIAAEAVRLLVGYLFADAGLRRVQAFVMPENRKSHPVLLKNGFTKEGVIRQGNLWTGKGVVDLAIYGLLHTDPRPSAMPAPPPSA